VRVRDHVSLVSPQLQELPPELELLRGEPELVIVDARVLRLLMGPLARLIILKTVEMGPGVLAIGEERFVWDDDEICP